jgi:hypothetical protein
MPPVWLRAYTVHEFADQFSHREKVTTHAGTTFGLAQGLLVSTARQTHEHELGHRLEALHHSVALPQLAHLDC